MQVSKKSKAKDWVGIGIESIWGLPMSHPFTTPAKNHDLSYDVWYLYTQEKSVADLPDEPYWYKAEAIEGLRRLNQCREVDKEVYFKEVDRDFYLMCKKIAKHKKSWWLHAQAEIFYRIVRAYAALR